MLVMKLVDYNRKNRAVLTGYKLQLIFNAYMYVSNYSNGFEITIMLSHVGEPGYLVM